LSLARRANAVMADPPSQQKSVDGAIAPRITANAAHGSPASASTFALSVAAGWSTSAHGRIAPRHGQLPTATRHDAEPADPTSASDQHHRARATAPARQQTCALSLADSNVAQ